MTYLSQDRWAHNGVEYEVNNLHLSDVDAWCHGMYALPGGPDGYDYVLSEGHQVGAWLRPAWRDQPSEQ
jgi:hypothetical protein